MLEVILKENSNQPSHQKHFSPGTNWNMHLNSRVLIKTGISEVPGGDSHVAEVTFLTLNSMGALLYVTACKSVTNLPLVWFNNNRKETLSCLNTNWNHRRPNLGFVPAGAATRTSTALKLLIPGARSSATINQRSYSGPIYTSWGFGPWVRARPWPEHFFF